MKKTWRQRIDAAKKRGKFIPADYVSAQRWRVCAIGERLHVKCIDEVFDKYGDKAANLGCEFCSAVTHDKVDEAERIYRNIKRIKVKP